MSGLTEASNRLTNLPRHILPATFGPKKVKKSHWREFHEKNSGYFFFFDVNRSHRKIVKRVVLRVRDEIPITFFPIRRLTARKNRHAIRSKRELTPFDDTIQEPLGSRSCSSSPSHRSRLQWPR